MVAFRVGALLLMAEVVAWVIVLINQIRTSVGACVRWYRIVRPTFVHTESTPSVARPTMATR